MYRLSMAMFSMMLFLRGTHENYPAREIRLFSQLNIHKRCFPEDEVYLRLLEQP